MTGKAARAAAWLLVLCAVVMTLGPQKVRPYTGIHHDIEHALAFALVGLAFGLGYPRQRMSLFVLAVASAGLMEFLQHWIPGRHATIRDFAVNGFGACAGIAIAAVLHRLHGLRRRILAPDVPKAGQPG
jgi:VanZ family protein